MGAPDVSAPFCVRLVSGGADFFLLMIGIGAIPGEAQALSGRVGDKLLHTLVYGFIAALLFRAAPGSALSKATIAFGMSSLLGLFDETLQWLLPYRNASLADWCFDSAAALLVVLTLFFLQRRQAGYQQKTCTESKSALR